MSRRLSGNKKYSKVSSSAFFLRASPPAPYLTLLPSISSPCLTPFLHTAPRPSTFRLKTPQSLCTLCRVESQPPSLAFSSSTHLPLLPTRSSLTPHTYSRHLLCSQSFPPSAFSPQWFGKYGSESNSTVYLRSLRQILTHQPQCPNLKTGHRLRGCPRDEPLAHMNRHGQQLTLWYMLQNTIEFPS